jgi:hypothetical protein
MEAFAQFVPLMLLSIPFAIGNYFFAKRINKNSIVLLVLSFVPVVNFFLFIYVVYKVIFRILDKLDTIESNQKS